MENTISIVVYSDYLCPWCYVAATRLQRVKEEYGARVEVAWKSYPLVPGETPGRRFSPHLAQSWERARLEEDSLGFNPWPPSKDLPLSSLPAQEAAKCAGRQGREAFWRFHFLLMRAYFQESQDIASRQTLASLAQKAELDVARFLSDFDSGVQRKRVLAEYLEAQGEVGIWGVPTAIFNGRIRLECAVPIEIYRRAVERLLSPTPIKES